MSDKDIYVGHREVVEKVTEYKEVLTPVDKFPRAIKKFLTTYWGVKEEDLKEELLADHYIVWYCGIDHVVDRTKQPEHVIVHDDFILYVFNKEYLKTENVVIKYKDDVEFSYRILSDFVEKLFKQQPFSMRVIQVPNGFYYLEFKLDDRYSYVYQQIYVLVEEDLKELLASPFVKYENPIRIEFNKVFKKLNFANDMAL